MTTIEFTSSSDFTAEEILATLQSRGFLQLLLYQKLEDGVQFLQQHDRIREAMIADLTDHHSQIESAEITDEFLECFCEEILTCAEPVSEDISDDLQITVTDTNNDRAESSVEAETAVQAYLESQLSGRDSIKLKANEIATETGLQSTNVGRILGKWRQSDDAPFSVSASDKPSEGNLWEIKS